MNRKKILKFSTPAILLIAALVFVTVSYQPLYRGAVSDHFDGRFFFYQGPEHSFTGMVKWMWEMETVEWPDWVNDPPQPKPLEKVDDGLRITYINHATVLLQMDGLNILTDPIFSERSGPFPWLGAKRVRSPGVGIEDLPPIDLVLISHDHYDHLDLETLKKLAQKDNPQIVVGLGVRSLLDPDQFPRVAEMDWWQEYTVRSPDVKLTFVPARHNSGRSLLGDNRTLWGGFVIEGRAGKAYFAGDTGYDDDFLEEIKNRFGSFRLTILPIGSYEKRWFMQTQHMNPDDAVKVHRLLSSRQSVGIHFGTFKEHPEQSIDAHEKDLASALVKYKVEPSAFWVLQFGEGRYVAK